MKRHALACKGDRSTTDRVDFLILMVANTSKWKDFCYFLFYFINVVTQIFQREFYATVLSFVSFIYFFITSTTTIIIIASPYKG